MNQPNPSAATSYLHLQPIGYIAIAAFSVNYGGGFLGGIRRELSPSDSVLFAMMGFVALIIWGSLIRTLGLSGQVKRFKHIFTATLVSPGVYLWNLLWGLLLLPTNETAYTLVTLGKAPYIIVFVLQFAFCAPIFGVLRLIPLLTPHVDEILLFDPLLCAISGVIYAGIGIVSYVAGKKTAQKQMAKQASPEEDSV